MIILGIDPGLARMGFGVIHSERGRMQMLEYGVVETRAGVPLPQPLNQYFDGMERLIAHHQPDAVAVEELFFSKNVTTAINVGQARGVALVAAARHTPNLFEYTPMQVKQAVTGYGGADKNQVQQMIKMLLKLPHLPKPDDAADALAVAICHGHSARAGGLFRIQ